MNKVITIKGIDDETWAKFKSMAALHKLRLGEMFTMLVNEYAKKHNFNTTSATISKK